uniref:Uncharacterized protein n=1 Tax=Arundo donax TaxID=35708 RepID=A0A0A8YRJ6_ARUDO
MKITLPADGLITAISLADALGHGLQPCTTARIHPGQRAKLTPRSVELPGTRSHCVASRASKPRA